MTSHPSLLKELNSHTYTYIFYDTLLILWIGKQYEYCRSSINQEPNTDVANTANGKGQSSGEKPECNKLLLQFSNILYFYSPHSGKNYLPYCIKQVIGP